MGAKNNKKRVADQTCQICKKPNFTIQGLNGHLRLVHGIKVPNKREMAASLAQTEQVSTETVQNIQENTSEEKEIMKEEKTETAEIQPGHDPATCPECQSHAKEVDELNYRLHFAQNQLETLTADRETEEETVPVPEVADFINHCEDGSCEHHAKEWQDVKARLIKAAIENIDPALLPDKVVESEALKRGFIPQRIILPGR